MKIQIFASMLSLICFYGMAQDSTQTNFKIKDYSLRDYVAPDIKYQRLEFQTDLNGNGARVNEFSSNGFNNSGGLSLFKYTNLTHFQGSTDASLSYNVGFHHAKNDSTNNNKSANSNLAFHYSGENRWYNSKDHFVGAHPVVKYNLLSHSYNNNYDTTAYSEISDQHYLEGKLFLSVGKGRIQPVTAARRAMDILISLEKYNRLAKSPSAADVDSLAKIANRVEYKRFYDKRYKRIYQLEELDKGIQGMGMVGNADMVYAANLSDIWGYGRIYSRGSGSRFEVGVVPIFGYNYYKESTSSSFENQMEGNYFGGYGVVNWTKQVPLSYAWQSDFEVSLSGGMQKNNGINPFGEYILDTLSLSSGVLSVNYTLGYYPNTRTFMGLTPFAMLTYVNSKELNQNVGNFGLNSGINLYSYYYVSPRFRIQINGNVNFVGQGYQDWVDIPGTVSSTNALFPNNFNGSNTNIFRYNYRLTLSYAIF